MDITQTAKLLSLAATFDFRLNPPTKADAQIRAQAWAAAIDDMPMDFAESAIITHYKQTKDMIGPSDFNAAYKKHLKDKKERGVIQKIIAIPATYPTDEYKQARKENGI